MRRETKIKNIINGLMLSTGMSLGCLLLPATTATASFYSDVSIVGIQATNDSTYSHKMLLRLDNREETLLLNHSEAFSNTDILIVDSADVEQLQINNFAVYQGQIENVPDSWVRLVVQDNEVAGIIDTGDERIHLNHIIAPEIIRQIQSGFTQPFYQLLADPIDPFDGQTDDEIGDIVEIDIGNGFFNQPEKVTKVASIAIVIDSAYDEAIGGRGLAQAISTINAVDGIYREEFGLALKVETAIMVTDNESMALGNISLEDNLTRFRDYRVLADQISNELALVHLFTGVITADASVGLAYIDTVCKTNGYDVSLSLPFRYPILLTAHEIGHNLGALHDDETSQCNTVMDGLMFSQINENSTRTFSSCSVDAISKRLEESTCHTEAIDMDVTLARQDDSGIIALITNTDTVRAFPAATLAIDLENATIAAAPASCEVISDNRVKCAVATTFAEDSQSMAFDLRLEEGQEISIVATLAPQGFLDVHSANNRAEIVIPQVIVTTPNDSVSDDDNPGIADATDGNASGGAAGSTGGGSLSALDWLFLTLILLGSSIKKRRRNRSRLPSIQPSPATL